MNNCLVSAWKLNLAALSAGLIAIASAHAATAAWSAWQAGPTPPSNVAADDLGGGVARVTWTDNAGDEDGFDIQREKQKGNGGWFKTTIVATVGADVTSVDDNAGTSTFRYRVRAFNGAGNSDWSEWTEVTLTAGGVDPPASLTWTVNSPVHSLDWYQAKDAADAHEEQGFDDWRLPSIEELQSAIADGTIGAFNPNASYALHTNKKQGMWIWRVIVVTDESGLPIPELSGNTQRLPIGSTFIDAKFVRP